MAETAITSTYFVHPEKSTIAHPEVTPKSVVLRFRVNDFEGEGRSWE